MVASEEVDGMSCYKFPQGDGGIKGYGVSVDRELIEAVMKALAAGEVRKEVVGTHRYGRGGAPWLQRMQLWMHKRRCQRLRIGTPLRDIAWTSSQIVSPSAKGNSMIGCKFSLQPRLALRLRLS